MKEELTEKRLKIKLDGIRTKRVTLLRNSVSDDTVKELKKLRKTIWRLQREWILDGYTRDILSRFLEILDSDIKSITD